MQQRLLPTISNILDSMDGMAKPSKKIRQQQELDAKELTVLLYGIFKDSETNGSVSNTNDKKLSKKED